MTERPRLLILTSTLPRWEGDAEPRFVLDLARAMSDRFDPVILAPMAEGAEPRSTIEGVWVERYRYAPCRRLETLAAPGAIMPNLRANPWLFLLVPTFLLAQLAALVSLLRRERFDAVHCHWLIPQGLVFAVAKLFVRTPPALLTCHGADAYTLDSGLMRLIKRWVLRRFAAVTVVSMDIAEQVAQLTAADLIHLPMGVDFGRFGVGTRIVPAVPTILFAGRLAEKKGVRHLIHALADERLRKHGTRLHIAGTGPLLHELEQLARDIGVAEAVQFLGARPHEALAEEMRSATLFCAPFVIAADGDREGTPTVLLEAAAASLPIVTSDVGGCRDIVANGRSGWLLPPGNAAALADALAEAIDDSPRAAEMATQARYEAERRSWPRIAAAYYNILTNISASRKEVTHAVRV